MTPSTYRALVVDDEPALRTLLMRALMREGFSCDSAGDGAQAQDWLQRERYDLVVTDLRMPNVNGHTLAVEVLQIKVRPVVIVLTGVLEPRLAKDLLARGVDGIEFKPVDYSLLSAKSKALVERHQTLLRAAKQSLVQPAVAAAEPPAIVVASPAAAQPPPPPRIEILAVSEPVTDPASVARGASESPTLEQGSAHVSQILPDINAVFEVFELANSDNADLQVIADAIQRDPSLASEVLQLANSSYYTIPGQTVTDLKIAIARIGQKRISELAVATQMQRTFTSFILPGLGVDSAGRRSLATGLAVNLLG